MKEFSRNRDQPKYDKKDVNLVTLSGFAGSGKSKLAKLFVALGYEHISIWDMKRELANTMGLSIIQFNEFGELEENKENFDFQYEKYQMQLDPREKIILDGRLSFKCQPQAFKVLLQVDPQEAAKRIFYDKRETDHYASVEEVCQKTKERNAWDIARYFTLYNVDICNPDHFNLIIDTTHTAGPQDNFDFIMKKLLEFKGT